MIWVWRALRAPGRPLALTILALGVLVRVIDPAPLQQLRLAAFDGEQSLLPRQPLDDPPVRIVQIDDESIAKYGQWPWPRTLIARLVEKIAEAKPKVLAMDILFAAPDRTSPPMLAKELPDLPPPLAEGLARLPSNDSRLAEAIAQVPTVLGFKLADREAAPPSAGEADLLAAVPHYTAAFGSIPEIAKAARAGGSISVEPDVDGVFRRLPLVAVRERGLVPGFAVAALDVATGVPAVPRLRASADGLDVTVAHGFAPADRTGAAWVYFAPQTPFFSATQLLDGNFNAADLEGRIVLLAVTSAGTGDLQRTPLGLMYGIEFHAQWIDTLLSGALLSRLPFADWIEPALLALLGLATIWLFPYEKPLLATGLSAAVVVILLGGEFALFGFARQLADGVFPAIGTLAAFGAMLQGSLGAAQVERRRLEAEHRRLEIEQLRADAERRRLENEQLQLELELERERERLARAEAVLQREQGELAAARDVQLGLMPHRFPAFLDRRDVEVYARIEPARETGGDLFDFLLIGPDRLFFFVGDVSGKGVPAALIMMMTKEVVREASARPGAVLDGVLAEANARIATASAELAEQGRDMMFVTAFAGILDLTSGEVVYSSAGHDAPFVVGGGRPRQLATDGGPPLGAVEDFAFPLDRARIEPGEIMLLYTDGVTEAQDESGALYSGGRLAGVLAMVPAETAGDVVGAVFDDVRRFAGQAEQADDITLLAIRRIAAA